MKRLLPLVLLVALFVTGLFGRTTAASRPIAYIPSTAGALLGDGTATVTSVAPSSTGNILTSNGSTWISSPNTGGFLYGTYAARPSAGAAATRVYVSSDAPNRYVDSGSEWRVLFPYGVTGKEPAGTAGWTNVNESGLTRATSFTSAVGRLGITWIGNGAAGGSGNPIRFIYRTAPASGATGYRVTIHMVLVFAATGDTASAIEQLTGLGWRQSSDGRIELMELAAIDTGGGYGMYSMTRRFTVSGTGTSPTFNFQSFTQLQADSQYYMPDLWMRIERTTSGDRAFYTSTDNLVWHLITVFSSTGNSFLTPDQVLIECSQYSASVDTNGLGGCYIDSYEETAY